MSALPYDGCTVYGWPVSPYSAKLIAAMRAKGVVFTVETPSMLKLTTTIKKAVGRFVMPTVRLADGSWRQDSAEIIDELERLRPEPTLTPPGPTQRLASALMELLADEWLPMAALHYRWNRPENRRFAIDEFAHHGFPWLPSALARPLAGRVAAQMSGYLPLLGVGAATIVGLEAQTEALIAALEVTLQQQPYLLGARPCVGDVALYGPLQAHLFRDPATTCLFDDAPAVRAWIHRLTEAESAQGAFLAHDEVPAPLDPIFGALFGDQWPYVQAVAHAVDAWCEAHPDAPRVPRALGDTPFTLGGCEGRRRLLTFTHWKAQRVLDVYGAGPADARAGVDAWLQRVGGGEAMGLQIRHRLCHKDFRLMRE